MIRKRTAVALAGTLLVLGIVSTLFLTDFLATDSLTTDSSATPKSADVVECGVTTYESGDSLIVSTTTETIPTIINGMATFTTTGTFTTIRPGSSDYPTSTQTGNNYTTSA